MGLEVFSVVKVYEFAHHVSIFRAYWGSTMKVSPKRWLISPILHSIWTQINV